MACFGCGIRYDEFGNAIFDYWPSDCVEYSTGIDKNGVYCREVDGKKHIYVNPDAHGRGYRQTRLASTTLDGPINNAPFFNSANSGTHIYNSRNGFTYSGTDLTEIQPYFSRGNNQGGLIRHNFSCARNWDFAVTNTFNCSLLCSANFKADFIIEESFNASTWTPRDNTVIDHTGQIALEDKLIFVDTTWNGGIAPLTTEYTDFRVQVNIVSGSVTLINPDFSATYWSGATLR